MGVELPPKLVETDAGTGQNQNQLDSNETAINPGKEKVTPPICTTNEEDFTALFLNDEPIESPI
ncbi:hypothetical protein COLO4_38119 [Corchorus olitorius]|uniref:Uncharacterized protein n=1 Tax=Corchorus olitorius TaxID=93759 RepID=A0A1R3FX57_9ROSI|nr:hypothetical protein COLO4_38119 [Corchorus olitorius]